MNRSLIAFGLLATALWTVALCSAAESVDLEEFSWGAGVGVNFGGIGVRVETPVADSTALSLTAAVGFEQQTVGVKRYFLTGKPSRLLNYVVARYGVQETEEIYNVNTGRTRDEGFEGWAFGVGMRMQHAEVEIGFRPKPTGYDENIFDEWRSTYIGVGYLF
jgi:hypothetical protein